MIFVGTAGWNVPRTVAAAFPAEGPHLVRYAQRMQCVEVERALGVDLRDLDDGACALGDQLPRHDVGVVLHPCQYDRVAWLQPR